MHGLTSVQQATMTGCFNIGGLSGIGLTIVRLISITTGNDLQSIQLPRCFFQVSSVHLP